MIIRTRLGSTRIQNAHCPPELAAAPIVVSSTLPAPTHVINNHFLFEAPHQAWRLLHHTLEPDLSQVASKCGQENLGNTCYWNALVAALAYLPHMRKYCQEHNSVCDCPANLFCSICALHRDCTWLISGNIANMWPAIATHRVLVHHDYNNHAQHDAFLAFNRLADVFDDLDWRRFDSITEGAYRSESTKYTTALWKLTGCEVRTTISCKRCQSTATNHEYLRGMSLSMHSPPPLSVESMLFYFHEAQPLGDDYKCDTCQTRNTSDKITEVLNAPRILALQLKRWVFDAIAQSTVKYSAHVQFPVLLPWDAHVYTLTSIVVHAGEDNSGHYIAYVRHADNTWYAYDDRACRAVNFAMVQEQAAYLLFYMR